MAQRCQALAIPQQPLREDALPVEADVLVDGLLGTGFSGALRDDMSALLAGLDALPVPRLALDIPSGLNADTGMPLGAVLRADLTCTFIGMKRGLLTGQGPVFAGELLFFDLQVPRSVYQQVSPDCRVPVLEELPAALPRRAADALWGCYGHVLVLGRSWLSRCSDHDGHGPLWAGRLLTRPEHTAITRNRKSCVVLTRAARG